MLEPGDDDLVAGLDVAPAPGLGDEVDPLGRPANEDNFARRRSAEETADLVARAFVGVGGAGGERVRAAMDVRILMRIECREPVDDRLRLLRRCAIVEPDQAPAVNPLLQDWKVVADRGRVESACAGGRVGKDGSDRRRRREAGGDGRRGCRGARLAWKALAWGERRRSAAIATPAGLDDDRRGRQFAFRVPKPGRFRERRNVRQNRIVMERSEPRRFLASAGKLSCGNDADGRREGFSRTGRCR